MERPNLAHPHLGLLPGRPLVDHCVDDLIRVDMISVAPAARFRCATHPTGENLENTSNLCVIPRVALDGTYED